MALNTKKKEVSFMIGSGLKKLANENGMKFARGVAYGSLRGYAATLSEGNGWKQIVFTTIFTDPAGKGRLLDLISGMDLKKQYRVLNLELRPNAIWVRFHDNPGTMKKIREFLDWFLPVLSQHSAAGVNICTECGGDITAGRWVLINGVAYHFHDSCAQKAQQEVADCNTQRKQADNGNYLTGLLGALGGSAIGAVVWGLVLYAGYVASLVGLLIGFLAEKGYNLLRGRQGKGKVWILVIAVIFGVVVGTFGGYIFTIITMINSGELYGFVASDALWILTEMMRLDPEFKSGVMSDILQGLLFAALGVFALLRNTGRAVADETYVVLE